MNSHAKFKRRNLPLLLLQAREGVLSHFRPVLNANGITEQQWRVIRALLEKGPMEPRQIGEVCRVSSPSMAGVLARMDDMGLVLRERFVEDQRRVMVRLSKKGAAMAALMAPQIEDIYAGIESHIGTDSLQRLYDTLDELIETLSDLPGKYSE